MVISYTHILVNAVFICKLKYHNGYELHSGTSSQFSHPVYMKEYALGVRKE